MARDDTYWAALPPDKLAGECVSRWRDWRRYYAATGLAAKAAKGRRYYYGLNDIGEASSHLNLGGERKDLLKAVINSIRALVQRSKAMITSGASEMTPVAANSDARSREQAVSAKGILEHIHREQDTETLDGEVVEIAMTMGEGYRSILWDANEGPETRAPAEDGQQGETAGDFDNAVLTPFDVARDCGWRAWRGLPWVIIRLWESKHELAARYPEKAREILAVSQEDVRADGDDILDVRLRADERLSQTDVIPVYHLYHLDKRALPGGRAFVYLTESLWLTDGANPYDGLPLERITPGVISATSLGYSNVFDALGVADLLNAVYSAVATNAVRWGVGTVITYKNSGVMTSQLPSGALNIQVNAQGQEPKVMETPQPNAANLELAAQLDKLLMRFLGLNETSLGMPPYSGMAAQAMALLDSKATEYQDGLAKSLNAYKAGCCTKEVRILKAFAMDERVAVIQGKAKSYMLKSFTGEDFDSVDRIAFEPVKASSRTPAGKFALLELMQQFGVQLKPEQIISLANDGQLESMFEHEQANVLRIKAENELLMDGQKPTVIIARTHWLDIPEHLALLSSPAVEERPDIVDAVLSTVAEKLEAWRSMPPDLLMLLKGPVPPPSAEQMAMAAAAGVPIPQAEGQPQPMPPAGAENMPV